MMNNRSPMIEVSDLTKEFNSFLAVDEVNFEVREGEIFGLLGPNGAGKTTIVRMLTGIIKPTSGDATIKGYDIQKNPILVKQLMGIVPEMANAYVDLSAMRNLLLMGELYGIDKSERVNRAENLLRLFALYEHRDRKVKTFSKGMKQRVIVAMALMNDSELFFLDEPTSGLDVESVRLIRGLIKKFNDQGVTIFLTTHDMSEADQLCDRIAIMNRGRIVAVERPEKLKRVVKSSISVEVAFSESVEKEELRSEDVERIEKRGDKFRLYTEKPENIITNLVEYSSSTDNKIISLNTLEPTLEEVFLKLTEEKDK